MLYFLLIGTILLRNVSFGACYEMAKATSISSLSLYNAGTTLEVLSVTRRLDKPKELSSSIINMAGTTLAKLYKGSHISIMTTLVTGFTPVSPNGPNNLFTRQTWPIISATLRLRLKPCWAVEQKVHSSAHPTCELTQRVARSRSGIQTVSTSWPSN